MVALENLSTLFRRGNVSMHKYVNINVEIAALKSKQEMERTAVRGSLLGMKSFIKATFHIDDPDI
jgi:hypothetical protein